MKELVKSFFCHSTLNADELVNLERDHSSENNACPKSTFLTLVLKQFKFQNCSQQCRHIH